MTQQEFKDFFEKELSDYYSRNQKLTDLLPPIDPENENGIQTVDELPEHLDCVLKTIEEYDEDYLDLIDTIGAEFDKNFDKDDNLELFKYIEKELEINTGKINIKKYELGNKTINDAINAFGIGNRKINKVVKTFTKALIKIKKKLPPNSI